nr:hypothetical protein [Tanacetum cinerariifolium]
MPDSDKQKGNNVASPSVVNMVQHNNSSRYNDKKSKCKHHVNTTDDPNKKSKVTYLRGDSGATLHVCKDRCWFKTYESLNDGSILHIKNESTTLVYGCGCVDLSVLNNCGYKQVIKSNKFVLSKHAFMSTFKLNDSILWHARLDHVHFKRMQDISKDGLIPSFDMDIEKWNNKYFMAFIDDALRFCYVYLLHSNDKALDKFKVFKTKVELQQGSLIKRFKTDKGGKRGIDCIFVGYAEHSKAFRPSRRIPNETEDIGGSMVPEKVTEEDNPKTYDEAMKSQDVGFWKKAINDGMDSTIGNNTWVLADLPPCYKPLGCEWIFKRKLKVDLTNEFLSSRFLMKDMEEPDVILGIKINMKVIE